MPLLPKGYKAPAGSSTFMTFDEGANRFRILGEAKIGWKGWKNKESFAREGIEKNIEDDEVDEDNFGKPNLYHIWVLKVWDYNESAVKLLEIRQKTVMKAIQELEEEEDWGDITKYDITVMQEKDGKRTKYTVKPHPAKPLAPEIEEASEESELDPEMVFKGENFGDFGKKGGKGKK